MESIHITLIYGIALCIVFLIVAIISYRREKALSFFNIIVFGVSIPWICTSVAIILSNKTISAIQTGLIFLICFLNILILHVLTQCKEKQKNTLADKVAFVTIPMMLVAIVVWIILIN